MKNSLAFITACFFLISTAHAQGKYAGTKKSLVGKTYTYSRNIPGLAGWEFREGNLVTPVDNPETITADVFQRGTTWLVFFSIREDTLSALYTIMDLVEIKNVQKGWQLRTAFCRRNKIDNIEIVALVKSSTTQEFLKPARQAWRFNRDKRRFEVLSVNGIDCTVKVRIDQYQ